MFLFFLTISPMLATTTRQTYTCALDQSCGWGLLSEHRSDVYQYIKSVCVCTQPLTCLLYGKNISLRAYVYTCRKKETILPLLFE